MNDARQNHIGNDLQARTKKTKAIIPTNGRFRPMDGADKRRKRNPKGQAKVCTHKHVADDFLRTSFMPKLMETEAIQPCKETAKMERDFYKSLSRLADHYHIQPMSSQSYPYPYNIALALYDTEEQLKNKVTDWEGIRLMRDSKQTYFASAERYNTGATLYYIPIVPLYRLMKMPRRKHTAQLLLSVCSYLYHIVDIPYYRQENSYLYWMYEMVAEWFLEDDENEDTTNYINEIIQADWIGEWMERKMYNSHNLSQFKERLNRFKGKDCFDTDCFLLAKKAFELYEQYPDVSIFRNALPNPVTEQDEQENILAMDKYISFCADGKGLLFQNLFDSVNNELQEYGQMQEPVIIKRFDGSDINSNDLSFERSIFALIEELICVLNNV